MKILEQDVQSLYKFALSRGFSTEQIKTCVSPMMGDKSWLTRTIDASLKSVVWLSVVVAVIAGLWSHPYSNKMIGVHAKLLSTKVRT